jgi:hypothetical protein
MENISERMHLFRGAPSVRGWSKYQETVQEWTLCGIRRIARGDDKRRVATTEDPSVVSCPFCQDLMKPTKAELARAKTKAATVNFF